MFCPFSYVYASFNFEFEEYLQARRNVNVYSHTKQGSTITFLIYRNMCPIVDKYFHERAKVRKNKLNKAFGGKLFIFLSKYMSFI